jgi:hypothetical protein
MRCPTEVRHRSEKGPQGVAPVPERLASPRVINDVSPMEPCDVARVLSRHKNRCSGSTVNITPKGRAPGGANLAEYERFPFIAGPLNPIATSRAERSRSRSRATAVTADTSRGPMTLAPLSSRATPRAVQRTRRLTGHPRSCEREPWQGRRRPPEPSFVLLARGPVVLRSTIHRLPLLPPRPSLARLRWGPQR